MALLVAGTAGVAAATESAAAGAPSATGPAAVATPVPTLPTNLVTNHSVEPGNPAGCFEVVRTGDGAVFSSGVLYDPFHVHGGVRSLGLWWVKAHTGSAAFTTGLSNCSPKVTVGSRYTASVWTKSTSPRNILAVYRQTAAGGWILWTDVRTFGRLANYSKVGGVTPPVPPDTVRLAFGIATAETGIIVTDDYALVEGLRPVYPLPAPAPIAATAPVT